MNRRQFIAGAGAAASLGVGRAAGKVSIALDPRDPVANAAPVQWAAKELEQTLTAHGATVSRCESLAAAASGDLCILAAGAESAAAAGILKQARVTVAAVPEALALVPAVVGKTDRKSTRLN